MDKLMSFFGCEAHADIHYELKDFLETFIGERTVKDFDELSTEEMDLLAPHGTWRHLFSLKDEKQVNSIIEDLKAALDNPQLIGDCFIIVKDRTLD